MYDHLSTTPEEALANLIQTQSQVPVEWGDFLQVFPPEVLPQDDPSGRNSSVTVRTTMEFTHAGRATFQYDRLDLGTLFASGLSATVDDVATFAQYLSALNARYGLHLTDGEIMPVEPFNVSGGSLTYQITVQAVPESLRFIGQGSLSVNVAWRLDDPETVELEVDRLHQLINYTLPETLTLI